MDTKQPQSFLLNLFQNRTKALFAEFVILFFTGIFAAAATQFIKMPLHLPGKQGLVFMFILTSVASVSNLKLAATSAASGSLAYFLVFSNIAPDPLKPFLFILVGLSLDFFIYVWKNRDLSVWFVGLAGALSWVIIPLVRIFIVLATGWKLESFTNGLLYPIITHLIFGFTAALVAAFAVKKLIK